LNVASERPLFRPKQSRKRLATQYSGVHDEGWPDFETMIRRADGLPVSGDVEQAIFIDPEAADRL
jgi:hypothetical protein